MLLRACSSKLDNPLRMINVICPRDGTKHFADESHLGLFLRCAKCGDAVQIDEVPTSNVPAKRATAYVSNDGYGHVVARSLRSLTFSGPSRFVQVGLCLLVLFIICSALLFHKHVELHKSNGLDRVAQNVGSVAPSTRPPWEDYAQPNRSLSTGSQIGVQRFRNGHGELTIENNSSFDAVVKVRSASGKAIRMIYIRSNDNTTLREFDEGTYRVLFTTGQDWDDEARLFTTSATYFEFGKYINFREEQQADGTSYVHHTISLDTVPDGQVEKLSSSKHDFDTDS